MTRAQKIRITRHDPHQLIGIGRGGRRYSRLDDARWGAVLRTDIMVINVGTGRGWKQYAVHPRRDGTYRVDGGAEAYLDDDDHAWLGWEAMLVAQRWAGYEELARLLY
jgi:hypothetical protein